MSEALFYSVFSIIFGALCGSFLYVCILRIPEGRSVIWPGSSCDHCGHALHWYENIPILSAFFLRFRCLHCGEFFGFQSTLLEVLSALWVFCLFRKYGLSSDFLLYTVFGFGLLVGYFIDLNHRILPDRLTLGGMAIGFLFALLGWMERLSWQNSLFGLLFGFVFFWLLSEAFFRIRGYEGLGRGDVKLLGAIGAFLGVQGVLFTLFVGSITGLMVTLFVMAVWKTGKRYPIPFGPFLSLGAYLFVFLSGSLKGFYELFSF
jgi:leader peptidase (prepilin peptidase)/N-methyltransferase